MQTHAEPKGARLQCDTATSFTQAVARTLTNCGGLLGLRFLWSRVKGKDGHLGRVGASHGELGEAGDGSDVTDNKERLKGRVRGRGRREGGGAHRANMVRSTTTESLRGTWPFWQLRAGQVCQHEALLQAAKFVCGV